MAIKNKNKNKTKESELLKTRVSSIPGRHRPMFHTDYVNCEYI